MASVSRRIPIVLQSRCALQEFVELLEVDLVHDDVPSEDGFVERTGKGERGAGELLSYAKTYRACDLDTMH